MKTVLQLDQTESWHPATTVRPFTDASDGLLRDIFTVFGFALLLALAAWPGRVLGQERNPMTGGAFTYQGQLQFKGAPANGSFDFMFQIYPDAQGKESPCLPVSLKAVPVSNGVFTALIDPGCETEAAFNGGARWLQIWVRAPGDKADYIMLSPRQPITPTPYAHYAARSGQTEWNNLTGTPSGFADGRDDDTTYAAGHGLELRAGSFALAGEGVGTAHLMPRSVTAVKIADEAVTTEKIGNGAVTGKKIGAGVIEESHLGPGFLTTLGGKYWRTDGNGGTIAGLNFLGTTDNKPLDVRVNNRRALRLEPHPSGPNIIAGASDNGVTPGVYRATIGGGGSNTSGGPTSTIAGGRRNQIGAGGHGSVIGGGEGNKLQDGTVYTTVSGGIQNIVASATRAAVIGGGEGNSISNLLGVGSSHATIGGGATNRIRRAFGGTIGGGVRNGIEQECHYATIAGGQGNLVSDFGLGYAHRTFIGGGVSNVIASAGAATIVGGSQNHVGENASYAFIGGGNQNDVVMDAGYAVIAGGQMNEIGSSTVGNSIGGGLGNVMAFNVDYGVIAGGRGNLLLDGGSYGAISGGRSNSIGGFANYGFIGSGQNNLIGDGADHGVVGGGLDNIVQANANYATIPGGRQNTAARYGFAAGRRARALHTGAFVWGDSTDANVNSSAANQFTVRASGGIRLFTSSGLAAGVEVSAGGTGWSVISDREAKENLQPVDPGQVLDLVAGLPITRWNMKTQDPSIQHVGPMAQDFYAAFALGENERRINTVDADGIALAAIQGLNHKLKRELDIRDTRIAALEAQMGRLQSRMEALCRVVEGAAD